MPRSAIAAMQNDIVRILLRQVLKEKIHTHCVALWHDKKATIASERLYCSKGITILPYMVAGNTWTAPFLAPAVFRLVDSFTGEAVFADHALQEMGVLGAQHIYFQLPYLRWFSRHADGNLKPEMTKELRRLPEQLSLYQKQAQIFIENILDIDQVGRDTQKNARQNYSLDNPCEPGAFLFQPIRVSFEPVSVDACGAVLYPDTIRDVIDFSLRDCVTRGIPVRRCRSCGRYFPLTGRVTAEYCSRPNPSGKPCRNTGAVQKWTESRRGDLVFKEYRREYKRRFAWIRAGKISEDDFSAWSKKAREKKADCDNEKISLDEFKVWLNHS